MTTVTLSLARPIQMLPAGPTLTAAGSTPPQPPAAGDKVTLSNPPCDVHFQASSRSVKRDCLLAALTAGSAFLPPHIRLAVDGVTGGLAILSGLRELHEGMHLQSTRQVLDGAAHIFVGGAMAFAGIAPGAITSAWASSGAVGLLGAKMVIDHPKGAIVGGAREVGGLIHDAILPVHHEKPQSKPAAQP